MPRTRKPGPSRRTSGKSQLLEHGVNTFHALGFQVYDSIAQFRNAKVIGLRYVIRNYPDTTIYGTRGKKEAFIVAPPSRDFVADKDGVVRILVEAKWQETAGSVDEKMPFVYESFIRSPIPNWIVIMDGAYWRTPRGKAVVAWMKDAPALLDIEGRLGEELSDKTWHVVSLREFISLATDNWGAA